MLKNTAPPVKKVLLVYNIDMNWPAADRNYAIELATRMVSGFCHFGYDAESLAVRYDLKALDAYDPREWLVFNWCEGYEGLPWSDAMVAEELEARKFVFTGSSSQAIEKSQNKLRIKSILLEAGIPTPEGKLLGAANAHEWDLFPALVKPVAQHGSFGITRRSAVKNRKELARQIRWIHRKFGEEALVEPFIDGREFQVTVWGNGKLQALPPVELDFSAYKNSLDRLYTYEAKFDPYSAAFDAIKWIPASPADDPALRVSIEATAKAAFRALECRDYARVDIRLSHRVPLVLDVNPNPDLEPSSIMPMSAEAAGLSYNAMAVKILEFAAARMRRQRTRRARKTTAVAACA